MQDQQHDNHDQDGEDMASWLDEAAEIVDELNEDADYPASYALDDPLGSTTSHAHIKSGNAFKPEQRNRRQVTHGGKRVPIELTPSEWDAVEMFAAEDGISVGNWLRLRLVESDATKITPAMLIRHILADRLMAAIGRRAELTPATGFEQANTPNDEDFADMVAAAQINGTVDLIGCTVMTGVNESGCVAFYIRNGWRDGLHMTISTPLTPAEWQERMGTDAL
ncbi:hypothetical protein ACFSQE_06410 [Vogesella fluminis]|uniref:Uncharacterized protein n=1 Tax=Vogesella fluminis TaxID=1069161 RepID=A0ABQ3HCR3_9NEIS|nr:hypothetical protein [Vogesella fluminis]GHD76933.1 hypothetical protein GCM10011419_16970 [Vogesella fluminis]